jgi:catechol 2,3-dioxygenase-like lactoylglutathione lyase family enzyme
MKISFVAGFGPIVADAQASLGFYRDTLGIAFDEAAPGYFATDDLPGVKAFALWPLSQAAESTFGTDAWPADIPTPQAWLEFDVDAPSDVAAAVDELAGRGYRVLRDAHEEPWGQTTSRVLSPEGMLVGVTYTPWMHDGAKDAR